MISLFWFSVIGGFLTTILYLYRRKTSTRFWINFPSKFKDHLREVHQDPEFYHVAVVGAGPAGATTAHYLAKHNRKCLLLEKFKFPRDKYCGDAVCKTAIEILDDMGVYKKLLQEKKARIADSGGLVSPSGFSYIGRSHEILGDIPAALACKRIHLDNAIAMAAKGAGADLKENSPVADAKFDSKTGLWTIYMENSEVTYKARVLVCADGAPSRLATKLGIVKRPPDGACSRSYVVAGTHNFKADGVIFYNKDLLPGYSAIFRHVGDELNYCVYIIPGNPEVNPNTLAKWHEYLKHSDTNISRILGPDAELERMKSASLRLGGEPVSYADHCLVVGDAAGMIDPMTGEGIHHAMEAGKMAAEFLNTCIKYGNYDAELLKHWHDSWKSKFGNDFKWSMIFCQIGYRFPIILDAATAAVQRKGDEYLAKWADIMTGRIPKIYLLKPEFSVPITVELIRLVVKRFLSIFMKVDLGNNQEHDY